MSDKKRQIVIIHGSFGNPAENWFPWLASQVRRLGHEAVVPAFPTPKGQNLDSWREAFVKQIGHITPKMIFVGHSLGPGFILNLLEETDVKVAGTFLVSGFVGELGIEEFDSVNRSFVCRKFDWAHIRRHAGRIYLYNSDNDPYVPLTKGQELALHLGAKLKVIKNGGHINAQAGYTTFPLLLEDLRLELSE